MAGVNASFSMMLSLVVLALLYIEAFSLEVVLLAA
jgi:hypothetical protein